MKIVSKEFKEIDLFFDPLNIGGAIGLDDAGDTIELHFDNPNQIEYMIHGLTELSNIIEKEYSAMDGEVKNDI